MKWIECRQSRRDDDDGRVVASMDLLSGQESPNKGLPSGSTLPEVAPMTRAETRRFIVSATLSALAAGLVLCLGVVALVLFCQFVWLR